MTALPIFELPSMEEPGEARRLADACESVGFFYLAGHGIDPALERRLEADTAAFFAMAEADKDRIAMRHAGKAWRGWFPVGGELTSGVADRKEGLYYGEDLGPDDPRVRAGWPMHGTNLFTDEPRGLRDAVHEFMRAQEQVGQRVLRAIAASLGLDPAWFATRLTARPTVLFRIFHYPPDDRDVWGVGEHTDYGLLTLLKQDDRGGLEVKTPDGWIDAPPIAGTFVCNLGDMLEELSGGRYRSTPHRVRNRSGASRYSWPFFLDPSFDAEIPGRGPYRDHLLAKVARVFPDLA